MPNVSADSVTNDTQQACIEDRPSETVSKAVEPNDNNSSAFPAKKRDADHLDKEVAGGRSKVARADYSESVEVPQQKAQRDRAGPAVGHENDTPQQSGVVTSAEPAASAAPFSGGFGGLASKGASGFAFGGTSTFGSEGFGSVAFGGKAFGSSAAGAAASFASKASKDDRGSPSVASNAGSAAAAALGSVFASTAEASNKGEAAAHVLGAGSDSKDKLVTGEEEEETVFSCKASLYMFDRSAAKASWKERGVGVLRLNVLPNGKSRLVIRQTATYRLILNTWLHPELKMQSLEGVPQVSFACVNAAAHDGVQVGEASSRGLEQRGQEDVAKDGGETADMKDGAPQMATYAIKFGSMEKRAQFAGFVEEHKYPQPQAEHVTTRACAVVDAIASSIV